MKNKFLLYGRYFVAGVVLILCVMALCGYAYPLKIFDIQFVPALQNGLISGFSVAFILFGAVIGLTLLFGRIYCSTLCPLGLYQEILTLVFRPFYKKRHRQTMKHYRAAYWGAAILFGTLCGGTVVLLRMFDPYSVAGNVFSGAWFGIGFAVALGVLVFFKKRFFCVNICPVGVILGVLSRFSPYQIRIDTDKCKACGLCARECPCGSIDFKNHRVNNETCVKCFKCLPHCAHQALFYGLPKKKTIEFSLKRRQLILAGAMVAVFGAAFKSGAALSQLAARKIKKVILPAGSENAEKFANRCLNCNLCVQNCPMKIIKPATADAPFVHLDYGDKYCDFDCHKCSEICPSGAIKRLTLAQKQSTKIATAVVREDVCISCGLCVRECPKQIIIKEDGEVPIIRFDACIGCGKCASVCPVKAISIATVDQQVILG